MPPVKKTVDAWLNEINYNDDPSYVPSEFALEFVSFIKLVNGEKGEEHKTPVIHYKMLDKIVGKQQNTANMCARGLAKTTIFGEYLFLYLAVYGAIPGFGEVDYALYVSDSIENGVKKMRLRLERRWTRSPFLQKYITETRFTDIRWYFKNAEGKELVVTGHGAKALSLDTVLWTSTGKTTIKQVQPGDIIYGPDGILAEVTAKSEIFNKPMYKLDLADGRFLKVSEDHLNSVLKYTVPKVLTTLEIFNSPIYSERTNGAKSFTYHIRNTDPLIYQEKVVPMDPYVLGLLLGDGSFKPDGSTILHARKYDMAEYLSYIPYTIGSQYLDKRNGNVVSVSLLGAYTDWRQWGMHERKHIPEEYFYGSVEQRLSLLQGLLDTGGTVSKEGKVSFCSTSSDLTSGIIRLVRSLGGTAKYWRKTQIYEQHKVSQKVGIWLNLPCFKLPRKFIRDRNNHSKNVAIVALEKIDDEPSQCIAINNPTNEFLANSYIRTHNTGVRGTVELNTRPQLAILDDLLSDEDARSATVIENIESTVYSAIDYALHPSKRKIIWSGTPFNAKDPLYKAIESGVWYVNVYPVCEEFPCTEENFRGAWPDRFTYDYVAGQYVKSKGGGKLDSFNQELMLRIMSAEDRLVADADIVWYKRRNVLMNKGAYNFYITTDFATSDREHADFSVINVWAFNNNGDWLWVDGKCEQVLMNVTINNLFKLAQEYNPQEVGIEISGQQKGFISWIQNEMMVRNIYFTLSKGKTGNDVGIRPIKDKVSRFRENAVPLFLAKKMWFPEELKDSKELTELMLELSLATLKGFKSKHDDQLDSITMLAELNTWRPSEVGTYEEENTPVESDLWRDEVTPKGDSSYYV